MTTLSQFRPPHLVDADARLARELADGDTAAVRALVERYAGPVWAVSVHGAGGDGDVGAAVAVRAFVEAVGDADSVEPGADFAPWLADHVARSLTGLDGGVDVDVERVWVVRATVDGLVDADRDLLRRRLVGSGGSGPADDGEATAVEQRAVDRLVQRLAHVRPDEVSRPDAARSAGERAEQAERPVVARLEVELGTELVAVLTAPATWVDVSADVGDRVVDRLGPAGGRVDADPTASVAPAAPDAGGPTPSTAGGGRQLRAVLLGAGGAVLLLAAGVVAFSAADDPPPAAAFEADLVPTGLVADVEGSITVTEFDAGLRIELDAPSLLRRPGDTFYQGWLDLDDGTTVAAGSFRSGDDVTLWAGVPLERATGMTIMIESPAPAPSADQSASGDVVFKVDFPPPDER